MYIHTYVRTYIYTYYMHTSSGLSCHVFSRTIVSSFFAACAVCMMDMSSEASPHIKLRPEPDKSAAICACESETRGRVGIRGNTGHGTNVAQTNLCDSEG
jgi:hypothetical protein